MNKNKLYLGLWAVLLFEFAYIFLVLLNYDLSWMNPEKFWTHAWILENGPKLQWQDITRSFNINVIELNPDRLSRPISNFVEVLDTKFRANSWQWIPAHPSFSLLWPLLFVVLPLFLYRFFINMGCQFPAAFSGVCLYLSSIGFLGPIIMLFHPAKSLVNFFGVLCLWSSSVIYKKAVCLGQEYSIKDIRGFWKYFVFSCVAMYLGFFSDETGLFVYLMNLAVLYPVLLKVKEKKVLWAAYLFLPVLYLFTLREMLPYIHFLIRGHVVDVAHYESYPHLWTLFFPNLSNLWTNLSWLFADYPHLTLSFKNLTSAWPYLFLQSVYTLIFIYMIFLFFGGGKFFKADLWRKKVGVFVLLLVLYGFFQTFQLSVNAKVWGVWWYGSLFSLIYFIALTFFLQKLWERNGRLFQKYFVLIIVIFVLEGLIFTTYRISIFKHQNLNRNNYTYRAIFSGDINPYTHYNFVESWQKSQCKYLYTLMEWSKAKHKNFGTIDPAQVTQCQNLMSNNIYFPIEILYLPIELRPKGSFS